MNVALKTPTARHKCNSDGTVVSGYFDAAQGLPEGWFHSPKEARDAFAKEQTRPVKRGRPPKGDK